MAESNTPSRFSFAKFKALISSAYNSLFGISNKVQDDGGQLQTSETTTNNQKTALGDRRRLSSESVLSESSTLVASPRGDTEERQLSQKPGGLLNKVREELDIRNALETKSQVSSEQASQAPSRTTSPAPSRTASPKQASPAPSRTTSQASSEQASQASSRIASPAPSRTASPEQASQEGEKKPQNPRGGWNSNNATTTGSDRGVFTGLSADSKNAYYKELRENRASTDPEPERKKSSLRPPLNAPAPKEDPKTVYAQQFGNIKHYNADGTLINESTTKVNEKDETTAHKKQEDRSDSTRTSNWREGQRKPETIQPARRDLKTEPETLKEPTPEEKQAKKDEMTSAIKKVKSKVQAARNEFQAFNTEQQEKFEQQKQRAFVTGGKEGSYPAFSDRMNKERKTIESGYENGLGNEQIIKEINNGRQQEESKEKFRETFRSLEGLQKGAKTLLSEINPDKTEYFQHYDPKNSPYEKTPPPHPGSQPRGTSLEGATMSTMREREGELAKENEALRRLEGLRGLKVTSVDNKNNSNQNSNHSSIKSYVGALTSGAGKSREGGERER